MKTIRKTSRLALAVIAGGALLALTACSGGGSGSGTGDDTKVLTIGAIAPANGPSAALGTGMINVIGQMFDDVNAQGGTDIGGHTYKLELKSYNDQGTPEGAQAAVRQALDDGRQIIIGPLNSSSVAAVQSTMATSDAFWLLNSALVAGPTKNPNVFRTAALTRAYDEPMVAWLKRNPSAKNVTILTDETQVALVASEDQLASDIKKAGRNVVVKEHFKLGDTDYRAVLSQAIASHSDVVIARASSPGDTAQIIKQLRELNGHQTLLITNAITNKETTTLFPDLSVLKDVYRVGPSTSLDSYVGAGDPIATKLADSLAKRSKDAGAYGAFTHDAVAILLKGLKQAKEPTPKALIASMTKLKASTIASVTINTYRPQKDGLLFQDREVSFDASSVTFYDRDNKKWVSKSATS